MQETNSDRYATTGTSEGSSSAFPHKTLLWIAAAALLIRLGWIHHHGFIIESEGAEYARLAENLVAGKGYVGMLGGRQASPELLSFS